jgi:hypothetical protein
MTYAQFKKKVCVITDAFLDNPEHLERLERDLAEHGSDSDHGSRGDALAGDLVRAAIDIAGH